MTPLPYTAVVLFQLGGPDSLDAVEPFLYNLFSDPDIIDFPGAFLARKPLARFIASRRKHIAAHHYAEIGGKSPIRELTGAQATALQAELDRYMRARVFVAMRYWHPMTDEVIRTLQVERFDRLVLLPLYPQYSKSTTGSSLNEWNRQCDRLGYTPPPVSLIRGYHDHPLYIEAIVDNVNTAFAEMAGVTPGDIDLVFSAHGVPMSLVKSGDPYNVHIEETVRLVVERGSWRSPHTLCYQSKVGPAKWLKPSLNETIATLAGRGRKHLLIIPIAFLTEHIETLHEINIEARAESLRLGVERFTMMPALNNHPTFIRCLTDLVLKNCTP